MAWPYASKDLVDAIAAATKSTSNSVKQNNEDLATGNTGQQVQSILAEKDLLQRQFGGSGYPFADPQQQLLAAQLVLRQQQQQLLCPTGLLPWGSNVTINSSSADGPRPETGITEDAAKSLSPVPSSKSALPSAGGGPTGASVGALPSNQPWKPDVGASPYFGFPFHPSLATNHLGGVGFNGGMTPQLGIPSMLHQVHQMQQLQQIQLQIQQLQQLQQHMQQQAHAFSLPGAASAASANLLLGGSGSAGSQAGEDSEIVPKISAMPCATSGLSNPLQGTGNVQTSSSNSVGRLTSANDSQELLRKSGLSSADQQQAAFSPVKDARTSKSKKNPSSSTSSKLSSHNTQKQQGINKLVALEPTSNDILSGRGNFVNNHGGNRKFRSLVANQRLEYVAAPKDFKPLFAKKIIDALKSLNPPGRFLQQDPDTKLWHELDEKRAMAKTRQALREGAPEVIKQIKSECEKSEDENTVHSATGADSVADKKKRTKDPIKAGEKHELSTISPVSDSLPEPKKSRTSSPSKVEDEQETKPNEGSPSHKAVSVSVSGSEVEKEVSNM